MSCHETKKVDTNKYKNILLIGPPNVGKSVIFNKLTGMNVSIANYAGTTVEFVSGKTRFNNEDIIITDVPGTYSLDATNEAEKVAIDMLNKNPDAVVVVLDANNIESSIYLLLQILQKELPTIAVLNRVDIAKNKNKTLNIDYLKKQLNIEIIPCVAIKNIGIDLIKAEIVKIIEQKIIFKKRIKYEASWKISEELTKSFLTIETSSKNKKETWEEKIIKPIPGIPIALGTVILVFAFVIGIGMSLRNFVLLPFFRNLVFPYMISGIQYLIPEGTVQNILIGDYGFLIKGIEWPITLVLPYVLSFYAAFSFLEDSGYLPRLGILLDGLFNKIGLSGTNIIPILLGYGCAIPAITSTRAMNTYKERVIVSAMISLSVPCISQTGAFISLLSTQSIYVVVWLFVLSFLVLITAGYIMNIFIKGSRIPTTIVEVPELLLPGWDIMGKKIWIRFKSYMTNGALMMFYAIAAAAFLYELGILRIFGQIMSPLVTGWLRLPEEASVPLILGIVRRELSVLPLLDMNLSSLQLFVGAVVGLFYVPCIAVIAMLAKEFKAKVAIGVLCLTMFVSFFLGGIIARIGELFSIGL